MTLQGINVKKEKKFEIHEVAISKASYTLMTVPMGINTSLQTYHGNTHLQLNYHSDST